MLARKYAAVTATSARRAAREAGRATIHAAIATSAATRPVEEKSSQTNVVIEPRPNRLSAFRRFRLPDDLLGYGRRVGRFCRLRRAIGVASRRLLAPWFCRFGGPGLLVGRFIETLAGVRAFHAHVRPRVTATVGFRFAGVGPLA